MSSPRVAWLVLALCGLVLVVLLGLALVARAEDVGYCIYWSREATRIDYQHETAEVTAEAIERQVRARYYWCGLQETGQRLPLPGRPEEASTAEWASFLAAAFAARQAARQDLGTAPADVGPPEWVEACDAEYRTFDRSDGTVVRRGSPERVRCPLKLVDGEWRIPE